MSKGLRIYIAGPMESAGGNWNFPLFRYVAKCLRNGGCEVFNPAEHIEKEWGSLENMKKMDKDAGKLARRLAMREEILWIMDNADLVFLLPGWEQSPGATAERAVALSCGIEVRYSENILLPMDSSKLAPMDLLA